MISAIERKLNKEISTIVKYNKDSNSVIRGNITYSSFLSNKMMMIKIIRQGVPYSLFNLIQLRTPFTEEDWANFLDISTKSLQRYRTLPAKHFKPIQSEKIIEMAEVTNFGLEIFGSMDKLKLWLHTPNFSLGNLKPLELLKDSYGKEMVLTELNNINHGIFV